MIVLVINAGSSSLKYQLVDMETKAVLAKGLAERIGSDDAVITHKVGDKKKVTRKPMDDHNDAIRLVVDNLVDPEIGVIQNMNQIDAVGHRVVHGGEAFAGSVRINTAVLAAIEDNCPLAPLHNPANIIGIKACQAIMPDTPQVAVFDTAFHQTMPSRAYMYALPYELYADHKVRRYGFHGTSHKYVGGRCAQLMDKRPDELRIITCHLGNGGSVAAIDKGKCVDTTMGLTPLEGLVMGTRCGDMDPAIIEFLMNTLDISIAEVTAILNKKSGLLGISGISNDFRDILAAMDEGNHRAKLAFDIYNYRLLKYIGAYTAAMGGVEAVVFTGGIGENSPEVREAVVSQLGWMGISLDGEKNALRGENCISTADSKVQIWVVPTDEEMAIAIDTADLAK